ncbi:MAG: zinc-dependent alcohol dehydrogenase [Hyphomicrobiaceae bacterium]
MAAAANAGSATIPDTMKAAVLSELRTPLQIRDVPVPRPGPGDILVKVTACGVCHSDLHAVDGDWSPPPVLPLIPGHEVAGHVAALGEGVTDFKVGDPVGVPWMFWSCGTCDLCLAGMETICKRTEATGYTKPGGYAEYMVAPAAFSAHLAPSIDLYEIAPVLCAGVTTYRGLKRTGVRPGQWVTVIGVGGLGHIAIQYARAMGLRIAAVDIADDKLALASSLGAELAVDARASDPGAAIQEATGGAHAAIVTAVSPKAFEQSMTVLRPGGSVAFIGLPGGDKDIIRASISAIVNAELSIKGSNVGTRADLAEAVDFAARGLIRPRIEKEPLANANAILERMRKGGITGRVVLAIR